MTFRIIIIGIIVVSFIKNRRDSDGYNIRGRNDAGRDRQGYDREGYDRWGKDRDGYDKKGYNRRGFDRKGLYHGYSEYDSSGYDKDGYNRSGFNSEGIHKETGTRYNPEGYNKRGEDKDGYNKQGFNYGGFDKDGYDRNGYDKMGFNKKGIHKDTGKKYDKMGLDKDGYNKEGFTIGTAISSKYGNNNEYGIHKDTGTKYDKDGFDIYGHDKDGYDRNGYKYGYDRNGYDKYGYDRGGFNKYGYDEDGFNKKGIHKDTGTKYDKDGFDITGFNKKGIHKNTGTKYDEDGYDKNGYDKNGLDYSGESKETKKRNICFVDEIKEFHDDIKNILEKGDEKGYLLEDDLVDIIENISFTQFNEGTMLKRKIQEICKKFGIKIIAGEKKLEKKNKEEKIIKNDKLKTLSICSIASGSNGNCYYIGTDDKAILIDDGISYKQLSTRMKEVNLDINSIKGIFISHEHVDHIRGLPIFYKNHPNIPIYFNEKAYHSVSYSNNPSSYRGGVVNLEEKVVNLDGFKIYPFKKKHDASYPLSFRVEYNGISVGVFTDIGEHSTTFRNHFSKCNAVFLEANHDVTMLRHCSRPRDVIERIYETHFSNDNAYDMLNDYASPDLQVVILVHISEDNNTYTKIMEKFAKFEKKYKIEIASRYGVGKVYKITE